MIDLKDLRENPDRYRTAAQRKRIAVDIDKLLELDAQERKLQVQRQALTAEKNASGKQIGALSGKLKKASPAEQETIQKEIDALKARPTELKQQEQALEEQLKVIEPQIRELLLRAAQ